MYEIRWTPSLCSTRGRFLSEPKPRFLPPPASPHARAIREEAARDGSRSTALRLLFLHDILLTANDRRARRARAWLELWRQRGLPGLPRRGLGRGARWYCMSSYARVRTMSYPQPTRPPSDRPIFGLRSLAAIDGGSQRRAAPVAFATALHPRLTAARISACGFCARSRASPAHALHVPSSQANARGCSRCCASSRCDREPSHASAGAHARSFVGPTTTGRHSSVQQPRAIVAIHPRRPRRRAAFDEIWASRARRSTRSWGSKGCGRVRRIRRWPAVERLLAGHPGLEAPLAAEAASIPDPIGTAQESHTSSPRWPSALRCKAEAPGPRAVPSPTPRVNEAGRTRGCS